METLNIEERTFIDKLRHITVDTMKRNCIDALGKLYRCFGELDLMHGWNCIDAWVNLN